MPRALVFQLPSDFSEVRIRDRLGQPLILDHFGWPKVFDANVVLLFDQIMRHFVRSVLALVPDVLMQFCDFLPALLAVFAVLWFS